MTTPAFFDNLKALRDQAQQWTQQLGTSYTAYWLLEDSSVTELSEHIALAQQEQRLHRLPDPYFANEPEMAPALLAMPAEAANDELWTDLLALALTQAPQRLSVQQVGALVWSNAPVDAVLEHMVVMASQRNPQGGEAALYRFQDPRVMQWLWPQLSKDQQVRWCGPAAHWWAVTQPVGPWSEQTAGTWHGEWWKALGPKHPEPSSPLNGRFLTVPQWQEAHLAASANRAWNTLNVVSIEAKSQPEAPVMRQWLHEAVALGLGTSQATGYAVARGYVFAHGEDGTWAQALNQTWVQESLKRCLASPELQFDNTYLALRAAAGHALF